MTTDRALIQQRYRERRDRGAFVVPLEIDERMVTQLSEAGYISPCWLEDDRQAVGLAILNALSDFLRR